MKYVGSLSLFQVWWALCCWKLAELPDQFNERADQLVLELDDLVNKYCDVTGQIRPSADDLYEQADAPGSNFDSFTELPLGIVLEQFWTMYFDRVKYVASEELMTYAKDVRVRAHALYYRHFAWSRDKSWH